MKKALTDGFLRSIKPPLAGRIEIADLGCGGLEFRATGPGARSWSFRFRDPKTGRVGRATIGTYPAVGLSAARERANDMRKDVAAGINPAIRKRRDRAEAPARTFGALATRYLAEHARRKKRSADADERNLNLHVLPKWKERAFDSIERAEVIELIESLITAGKPTLANRVHALISTVYGFAIDAGLTLINPCARLRKRGVENVGRRVLTDPEIRLFWPQVVHSPITRRVGLGLRLLLLTGTRAGEVAGMGLAELEHMTDQARAAWAIPAERVKNGRAHYVPLSPMARALVLELIELAPADCQYLFPSRSNVEAAMSGHTFPVAMARFAEKLENDVAAKAWKADPPTPHDLRRTLATRLSQLGVVKEDRDAVMNHAPQDVGSRVYDLHTRAQEKRRALNLWADSLASILGNRTAVVPIAEARRRRR
jgi:integrase